MDYAKLQVRVIAGATVFSLLAFIIGSFLIKDRLALAYGMVFGSAISILMFLQTAKAMSKSMTMNPSQAQKYVSSRYIIRMLIYGTVLFVALRANHINVLGTIVGFLSVKFSVVFLAIIKKI